MNLIVTQGTIFLKPVEGEETTNGGIILATTTSRGNVAEISHIHEYDAERLSLKAGDRVIFNPFSVREVNVSGTEKLLAILASDVLARVVAQVQDEIQLETIGA
jgi:co-chaperonin GroES (HSP10)